MILLEVFGLLCLFSPLGKCYETLNLYRTHLLASTTCLHLSKSSGGNILFKSMKAFNLCKSKNFFYLS